MSDQNRKRLFDIISIDNNTELDYLGSNLSNMNLTTIENITVNAVFEHRPDLISFEYYGDFNYGWLVAHHNDIIDPNTEFTLGRTIAIPSLDEYFRFVSDYSRNSVSRRRERL
ncbi:hypothetical protein [Alishewanella phage vB_AspM_Slickus01]|nr:hypothetical protein [Alishewanella phage vB_AspM_Slicko01]WGH49888.1 hypothetical protein [Alishewanella phage vB_AspM_Slickus01]